MPNSRRPDKPGLKRADLLLAAAVILAALAAWLLLGRTGKAATVTVSCNGETVAVLPLDRSARMEVNGVVIVVGGGAAYVERSTCPDQYCVKKGGISRSGETIICLPNRVTVTALTGDAPEVDAVT